MEQHLGPLGCVPYQDDIVVASATIEEHISKVKQVLEIITYEMGLRLRLKKCRFFKATARILGYLVTRDGIQMDPAKVKDIVNWPRPIDGKSMQRFLGACNFHQEFFQDFATIVAPLDECRKEKIINWTDEKIAAFDKLKQQFGDYVQLNHIQWVNKFT